MKPPSTINIFSVDVEDYFMVSALQGAVDREKWEAYESRVERSTRRLLDLLDASSGNGGPGKPARATFFCLGWVAERYPGLVKEIAARGHEIATHGHDHRTLHRMAPEDFRSDVRRSKAVLEDLTGKAVLGYRAPSYSITRRSLWALEILAEEGFVYDSSIFPVHHDTYGIPDAPRFPFGVFKSPHRGVRFAPLQWPSPSALTLGAPSFPSSRGGNNDFLLLEFPLSTVKLLGQNLAVAGGGYFRILPFRVTRWAARKTSRQGIPFVFYVHPWEIDPDQPRVAGIPLKSRFRHYHNLHKTFSRLQRLLRQFAFSSFRDFIGRNRLLPLDE